MFAQIERESMIAEIKALTPEQQAINVANNAARALFKVYGGVSETVAVARDGNVLTFTDEIETIGKITFRVTVTAEAVSVEGE